MTRSFLGASLITLSCLALAAACGDDEGDDNSTGGRGGTSTAGSGGSGMAGSGTAGTNAAGTSAGGTGMTGGTGGTASATAGTGGMAGSTNTGVVLDAGLGGGGNEEDSGGGGGEPPTNEFDAAFAVLVDNCGNCHGAGAPRPQFAQANNIEASFAVTEQAAQGGTIANRIIQRAVTLRTMPPACNGGALGTGQCLTQAEANTLQAWVAAGADR